MNFSFSLNQLVINSNLTRRLSEVFLDKIILVIAVKSFYKGFTVIIIRKRVIKP